MLLKKDSGDLGATPPAAPPAPPGVALLQVLHIALNGSSCIITPAGPVPSPLKTKPNDLPVHNPFFSSLLIILESNLRRSPWGWDTDPRRPRGRRQASRFLTRPSRRDPAHPQLGQAPAGPSLQRKPCRAAHAPEPRKPGFLFKHGNNFVFKWTPNNGNGRK